MSLCGHLHSFLLEMSGSSGVARLQHRGYIVSVVIAKVCFPQLDYEIVFDRTAFHSYQQCMIVSVAPHLSTLDGVVLFNFSSSEYIWIPHCGLICIFLSGGVERVFICLLVICISCFVKCLFCLLPITKYMYMLV